MPTYAMGPHEWATLRTWEAVVVVGHMWDTQPIFVWDTK